MIEDTTVRGPDAADLLRCVCDFAAFLGRSPDTATADELRRWQLHQCEQGCSHRASTARSRRTRSATVNRTATDTLLTIAADPKHGGVAFVVGIAEQRAPSMFGCA